MCGIVGAVGEKNIVKYLISGLKTLDYRGYDSAGVALFDGHKISTFKCVGTVENLEKVLMKDSFINIGIGHTRWATHGAATIENTHPHISNSKRFVLVHNGAIENYSTYKQELLDNGYSFYSQTDTEVMVNLIEFECKKSNDVLHSIQMVLDKLKGSLAIALIDRLDSNKIYFAKRNSPLLIGKANGATYLSSDALSMIEKTNKFIDILDNQYGYIDKDEVVLLKHGIKQDINYSNKDFELLDSSLHGYEHYMLKEIEETPKSINRLIENYFDNEKYTFNKEMLTSLNKAKNIAFIACGTSYHASLIGKEYFEKIGKHVENFIASEWSYFPKCLSNDTVFIIISQSGETADAIKCLNIINENHLKSITITNTKESTLQRNSTYSCLLYAGIEMSVAATKTYSCQVALLYMLVNALKNDSQAIINLSNNNKVLNNICLNKLKIKDIATKIYNSNDLFFVGKGLDYYIALEGALKLKETAYIHSEALPSGELKHGAIALVLKDTPIIGIISDLKINDIVRNNYQQVIARGANVYSISFNANKEESDAFVIDDTHQDLKVLASIMVLQYLAYYTAVLKGTNVDKPRNLAKSVTVE